MNATILFVDDDLLVLEILKKVLSDEPFNMIFTNSVPEALEVLQSNEIDVVVTDMRMPGIDGIEFLSILKQNYPLTVRIMLSGYVQVHSILEAINKGEVYRFLTKPLPLNDQIKLVFADAIAQSKRLKNQNNDLLSLMQVIFQHIDHSYLCFNKSGTVLAANGKPFDQLAIGDCLFGFTCTDGENKEFHFSSTAVTEGRFNIHIKETIHHVEVVKMPLMSESLFLMINQLTEK